MIESTKNASAIFNNYTNTCQLLYHKKVLTRLDLEPKAGHRLVSGSYDGGIAFWDFGSMTKESIFIPNDTTTTKDTHDQVVDPWRVIDPLESQPIKYFAYSPCGKHVAVSASSAYIQLFSKDAHLELEYIKGDQYIRDLRTTQGHVAVVNGLLWRSSEEFASWSADGTIRWWSTEQKTSKSVLNVRGTNSAQRVPLTALAFEDDSNSRKRLYVACEDGLIRVFSEKGPWTNTPLALIKTNGVSSLYSWNHFLSARTEHSVILWDTRNLKTHLSLVTDLKSAGEWTNLIRVKDTLLTTTLSRVVVLSDSDLSLKHEWNVLPEHTSFSLRSPSLTCLTWHSKLEQIFVGSTTGAITVLYSPTCSQKGILLGLNRTSSKQHLKEDQDQQAPSISTSNIVTPFAPEEADDATRDLDALRRVRYQQRANPVLSHRPDLPVRGFGYGGRIGSSVTQQIMQSLVPDRTREQDPREALLAFADQAATNPKFVSPAYRTTQPKPIFDTEALAQLQREQEEEQERKRDLESVDEDALRAAIRRKLKHQ